MKAIFHMNMYTNKINQTDDGCFFPQDITQLYPDIEYISNVLVWKYVTNASFFDVSNGKAQASVPTLDYSMIKSARKIMSGFFKEGFSEGVISTLLKKIRHFLAKEFRTPIDW